MGALLLLHATGSRSAAVGPVQPVVTALAQEPVGATTAGHGVVDPTAHRPESAYATGSARVSPAGE
jgi:hypothetical protein